MKYEEGNYGWKEKEREEKRQQQTADQNHAGCFASNDTDGSDRGDFCYT